MTNRFSRMGAVVSCAAAIFLVTGTASAQLSKDEQKCRGGIAKSLGKISSTVQKELGKCHKASNKDNLGAECNSVDALSTKAQDKIEKIASKLGTTIIKKCTPLGDSYIAGRYYSCPTPCTAEVGLPNPLTTFAQLGDCLECVGRRKSEAAADAVLGDPGDIAADAVALKCHAAAAKGYGKYLSTQLKVQQGCMKLEDKTATGDLEVCAGVDGKDKILGALNKADAGLLKSCGGIDPGDALPANLNTCGASTIADLQTCAASGYLAAGDLLFPDPYQLPPNICPVGMVTTILAKNDVSITGVSCTGFGGVCVGGLNDGEACNTIAECPDTGTNLSVGFTGLAHDNDIPGSYETATDVTCDGVAGACAPCTIDGIAVDNPLSDLFTRCVYDTSQTCSDPFGLSCEQDHGETCLDDADCAALDPCVANLCTDGITACAENTDCNACTINSCDPSPCDASPCDPNPCVDNKCAYDGVTVCADNADCSLCTNYAGTTTCTDNADCGLCTDYSSATACTDNADCGQCDYDGETRCTDNLDCGLCDYDDASVCRENADCSTCIKGLDDNCPGSLSVPNTSFCGYYLGGLMASVSGGTPVCSRNRLASDLTGTVDPENGTALLDLDLLAIIHLGSNRRHPCPICAGICVNQINEAACEDDGDCATPPCVFDTPQDGVRDGKCLGAGTQEGQPCDIQAFDETHGPTSHDCPPTNGSNFSGEGVKVALPLTTGTDSLAFENQCDGQAQGVLCGCGMCSHAQDEVACRNDAECEALSSGSTCTSIGSAGEFRVPNQCTTNPGDSADKFNCTDMGVSTVSGLCTYGPFEFACDGFLSADGGAIIPCSDDSACDAETIQGICPSGDCGRCLFGAVRKCLLDPVVVNGTASPFDTAAMPETQNVVIAGNFCLAPTSSPVINGAIGTPGPGAVEVDALIDVVY